MRYKAWRSNTDNHIQLIAHEGGFNELPTAIRQLGPWHGSSEGEVQHLNPCLRGMLRDQGFALVYRHVKDFEPEHQEDDVFLEAFRSFSADARAALRMIREALVLYAPPGSVPSEEMVEPPLAAEAAVLVNAILAIVEKKNEGPSVDGGYT